MNIEIYKERLRLHDWYYMMSDDPRIYDAGKEEERKLKELAVDNDVYMKEYEKMKETMFPK